MKKTASWFVLVFALLGLIIWSIPWGAFAPRNSHDYLVTTTVSTSTSLINVTTNLKNMESKILMLLAFKDFRDEEYFVPKEILEKSGYLIETVSNQKGIALGVNGNEAIVTKIPSEININDYVALIIVGGPGMIKNIDNSEFQQLAQDFNKKNKIIGAICVAPALLAKAHILTNKKATVWSSNLDKSFVKILEQNGALYQSQNIVQDGNIITANGPEAASVFGQKILEILKK